jgi:short subunit fatty acids transporter
MLAPFADFLDAAGGWMPDWLFFALIGVFVILIGVFVFLRMRKSSDDE